MAAETVEIKVARHDEQIKALLQTTVDGWIQRRLRMCLWKQWKRIRNQMA